MTEQLMIKIVATTVFVGIPMLVAMGIDRLLRHVSIETLRHIFWGLMATAAVTLLVLLVLNPARSGSAGLKTFGNILAGTIMASFFAALIVGAIAKRRRQV